jgi:CheY-like chemotaxis protein
MLNSYFESTYDITLHDAPGGRANSLGGTSSLKSVGGEGDLEEDGEDDMVGLYAQDLARCRGARCLFAEDNEFTVEVLKCLVSGAGMHAQWVTDGRAAVEAVASAPSAFDVIVMDCQMPLMGGVEASKQIRAAEVQRAAEAAAAGAGAGAAPSTVVIIGLSAYELHRKQCEAAGMNKFVVKPIGRAALIHLIAEVMGARRPASAAAAGGADSNASPSLRPGGLAESRVVFCPIDEAKAQRALGGTRELLRSALSRFATGELKRVDALEAALAASDWKALHMGAHALKGSASSIAAASLASACARLQQACCEDGTLAGGEGAGAQAAVAELVSALRGEAERMRAYANKFSGGGAAAATAAAAAVSSVWGDEGGAAEASAAESGFASKAATTAEGAPVLVVAGTAATAAAAAAAAAAPAAGSALDLSRFASFSARELQSWARDVLLMPEQVCEALHQANVDGEDAKEFSDEDWAQLAAECELSGMVVNKLRRKCRKAAADAEARAAAEESAAGLEELCDV